MNKNKFNFKFLALVPLIIFSIFALIIGVKTLSDIKAVETGKVDDPEVLKLYWRKWDEPSSSIDVTDNVDYRNASNVDKNKLKYVSKKGDLVHPGNGNSDQTIIADKNIHWKLWNKGDEEKPAEIIATNPVKALKTEGAVGYLWWEHTANAIATLYGFGQGSAEKKEYDYTVGSNMKSENDSKVVGNENTNIRFKTAAKALSIKDIADHISYTKIDNDKHSLDSFKKEYNKKLKDNENTPINYLTLNKNNSDANNIGISKDKKTLKDLNYDSDSFEIKRENYTFDNDKRKKLIHKKEVFDLASKILGFKDNTPKYSVLKSADNLIFAGYKDNEAYKDVLSKGAVERKILPIVKLDPNNKYTEVPNKFRINGERTWAINVPDKVKTVKLNNKYGIFAENVSVTVFGDDENLYKINNLDKKEAKFIVKDWDKLYHKSSKFSYEITGLPIGFKGKAIERGDYITIEIYPEEYNGVNMITLAGGLDRKETLSGNIVLKKKVGNKLETLETITWDKNNLGFKKFKNYPFTDSNGNVIKYIVETNILGGTDKYNYKVEQKTASYTSGFKIEDIKLKFVSPKVSYSSKINVDSNLNEDIKVNLYANGIKLKDKTKVIKNTEKLVWNNLNEFDENGRKLSYVAYVDVDSLKENMYLKSSDTVSKKTDKFNLSNPVIISGGFWEFPEVIEVEALKTNNSGATEVLEKMKVKKKDFIKNNGIVFVTTEKQYEIEDGNKYDIRINTQPQDKALFNYDQGDYIFKSPKVTVLGNVKYSHGDYLRKNVPVLIKRVNQKNNEEIMLFADIVKLKDFEVVDSSASKDIKFEFNKYNTDGDDYEYSLVYPELNPFDKSKENLPKENSVVYTYTAKKDGKFEKKIIHNNGADVAINVDLLVQTETRVKDKSEIRKKIVLASENDVSWTKLPVTTSKGETYVYTVLPELKARDNARGYYIFLDKDSNIVVKYIAPKKDYQTKVRLFGGEDKRKNIDVVIKRTSDLSKFEFVDKYQVSPEYIEGNDQVVIFEDLPICDNKGKEYTYIFEYPTDIQDFKKVVIPEVEEAKELNQKYETEKVDYVYKDDIQSYEKENMNDEN